MDFRGLSPFGRIHGGAPGSTTSSGAGGDPLWSVSSRSAGVAPYGATNDSSAVMPSIVVTVPSFATRAPRGTA